ncbi:hypothetical protein CEUSTIGMA_g8897.t1 [Chlamydomonas eustigma]|uniref:Major facilitator superfamily (MFS) profile domain-containing protein n=1 Tax=Chlamydomonas eustigma TaxID=1157962 RepID=A0A250XEF5_9CHLO|nr:hypothetical protein CEUSTIGMA_g8897.t1 [Chlamydomonas eustigma]|eukprot:GAX81468.1 hypothetical protein CEUSTIGMA_g8897.t1 [Chlamydomonas eustigma]
MKILATDIVFFLISVSYKLPWTCISSLLSQFSRDYGPEVLLQLNFAYFFPSIPILVLQTIFNERMDQKLGLPLGALVRFVFGLGGLSVIMSFFPILASTHLSLLLTTVAVGICYGAAFGTSYQLASRFPASSTVALTTGFVSSGPIVLVIDLWVKKGTYYTSHGLSALCSWVALITSLGLLAAMLLIFSNTRSLRMGSHSQHVEIRLPDKGASKFSKAVKKNSTRKSLGDTHALALTSNPDGVSLESMESGESRAHSPQRDHAQNTSSSAFSSDCDEKQYKKNLPMHVLAWKVAPAAISIFLSVGTSMLVFPFFTYVQSTGLFGERLAQVLFYVRLIGDIVGRLLPPFLKDTTAKELLVWGAVKSAVMPMVLLSIFLPQMTHLRGNIKCNKCRWQLGTA